MPFDFIRVSLFKVGKGLFFFEIQSLEREQGVVRNADNGQIKRQILLLLDRSCREYSLPYQLFASRSRHACIVRVRAAEEAYAKSDIAVIRLRAHIELSF